MLEVLKSNDIDVTMLEDPSSEAKDMSGFVDDPNALYWRDLKLGRKIGVGKLGPALNSFLQVPTVTSIRPNSMATPLYVR